MSKPESSDRSESSDRKDAIEPDKPESQSSGVEFYHYGEEPSGTPPVMPEDIGDKIFKEPGTAEPLESDEP